MVANFYGINTKIVIPNTQSEEKKDALRNLGAELIEVDAVPYSDQRNYVKYSKNVADELSKKNSKKVYWANQFDNTINKLAHIDTTSQEILKQTENKVDAFTCSVGTGGTLAGTWTWCDPLRFLQREKIVTRLQIWLAYSCCAGSSDMFRDCLLWFCSVVIILLALPKCFRFEMFVSVKK